MTERTPGIDTAHFERKLRARSGALRDEIRDTLLRGTTERYSDIAGRVHDLEEAALADLLIDVRLAEIERDVEELRDIDGALRRIATGTYGTCIRCGEPIDRARLEAYPTAKRCLTCQRLHERQRAAPATPSL